jgi:N6-L-threonylcarbamoyladenine synthase
MKLFLGMDTSCYTTSVAVMDEQACLVAQKRKLLCVSPGKRGLAQSEMVFQHTRNLPQLFHEVIQEIPRPFFQSVGVSTCPRPVADSYMPAFLVGKGYAEVIALSQGISCHGLSHQENHIYAGLWSVGKRLANEFLALHVSGGTTELVKVQRTGPFLKLTLLAATTDISAGQLIDRMGVKLTLPFPAGPQLEKLAATSQITFKIGDLPIAFHDGRLSFSGPETHLTQLIAKGQDSADIPCRTQWIVAETLSRLLDRAMKDTGLTDVLLVGGVMSNQFLRDYLVRAAAKVHCHSQLFFAKQEFSSDHAVGAAYFSLLQHHS